MLYYNVLCSVFAHWFFSLGNAAIFFLHLNLPEKPYDNVSVCATFATNLILF